MSSAWIGRWSALILLLPLPAQAAAVPLHSGWKLQSGSVVKSSGEQSSSPNYRSTAWIDAIVPGTVNYRANTWLNGKLIATSDAVAGLRANPSVFV
jgi:hypothetical protein